MEPVEKSGFSEYMHMHQDRNKGFERAFRSLPGQQRTFYDVADKSSKYQSITIKRKLEITKVTFKTLLLSVLYVFITSCIICLIPFFFQFSIYVKFL